jgi:hypothetical protein
VEVGERGEVGMDDLAQQGARRDGHDIKSGTGNAWYVGGSKRPCRVSIQRGWSLQEWRVKKARVEEKTTSTQPLRSRCDIRWVITRREREREREYNIR